MEFKRKLTAILSADVAGYSSLMDDDEVSTVRTLQAYQKIISDLTASYIFAGMKTEAYKQANVIMNLYPDFSVDNYAELIPYKNQSDTDRILNALRKAGLK